MGDCHIVDCRREAMELKDSLGAKTAVSFVGECLLRMRRMGKGEISF